MAAAGDAMIPVVLSGGAGTRLWPLSRELYPKQLLPLLGAHTMLQDTVLRLRGLEVAAPIVVCNEAHRFLVAEQLRAIDSAAQSIVLEPVGRNTAPAIALAAHAALAGGAGDPMLLVLPADHVIANVAAFQAAVRLAATAARDGQLVTFGVVPRGPETGYGYIRRGASLPAGGWRIARFVEKPERARAEEFLASGEYYWNSGMFLFSARRYLEELRRLAPDISAACEQAFAKTARDLDFTRVAKAEFENCRSESIDYAVMEKTGGCRGGADRCWLERCRLVVLAPRGQRAGCRRQRDPRRCARQSRRAIATCTPRSRWWRRSGWKITWWSRPRTPCWSAPRSRRRTSRRWSTRIKGQSAASTPRTARYSGPGAPTTASTAASASRSSTSRCNPGAELSLQMHHKRAEHWIVVSGTARITCGEEVFPLKENQSTYIRHGRSSTAWRIPERSRCT